MKSNILGIDKPNSSLYRIFSLHWFRKVLEDSELVLVKPEKWDDPFEAFLLQKIMHLPNDEKANVELIRDRVYGQCWMTCSESDAMWRIYSYPDNPAKGYEVGVKVRTSVNRLFRAFWNSDNGKKKFAPLRFWIGKVKYPSLKALENLTNDDAALWGELLRPDGKGLVQSLLLKRKEFSHEKEVRLIYLAPKEFQEQRYHFQIDPNDLFTEVILDPRMNDKEAQQLCDEIKNLGFRGKVGKSNLYLPPRYHAGFKLD